MTRVELELLHHVSGCRLLPGSWDKRFVRQLASLACKGGQKLSAAQREQLGRIHYRYRRQHGQPTPQQYMAKAVIPRARSRKAREEERAEP